MLAAQCIRVLPQSTRRPPGERPSALQAGAKGWGFQAARISRRNPVDCRNNGHIRVMGGPFGETKEPIAGCTLIQVRLREEALEWSRRCPSPAEPGQACHIQVRQLFEMEHFAPQA